MRDASPSSSKSRYAAPLGLFIVQAYLHRQQADEPAVALPALPQQAAAAVGD